MVPTHTLHLKVELASLMPSGVVSWPRGTHPHLSAPQHLPCSHLALMSLEMLWPLGLKELCLLKGKHSRGAISLCKPPLLSAGSLALCVAMLAGAHSSGPSRKPRRAQPSSARSCMFEPPRGPGGQAGVVPAWGPLGTVATPSHSHLANLYHTNARPLSGC